MRKSKKVFSLLFFSLLISPTYSAENKVHQIEDIVVTATLNPKKGFDVPSTIKVINEKDIKERLLPRTLPEMLKESNGILVQKTGHGQGSPFIRGFTSFRNLFLMDGIRLNNSVFRDGPNQYWSTVDAFSLSKIEILSAPSSAIYGSDAVGGTVQSFSKGVDFNSLKNPISGSLFSRFSSAEDSKIIRLEVGGGLSKKTDLHLGGTLKEFGDLKIGDGVRLPKTGYDEYNYDFKLNHYFSEESYITLAHNKTVQDDAWRTHKTIYGVSFEGTKIGTELQRILDQQRNLSYIQFNHKKRTLLYDKMNLNISLHNQSEDRDRIRLKSGKPRQDLQGFNVDTRGLWARFEKNIGRVILSYGVENYFDKVDSYKNEVDLSTGKNRGPFIQGPIGDDSEYESSGAYLQVDAFLSESFNILLGSRYSKTDLYSKKVEDPLSGNEIQITNKTDSLTSNFKFVFTFVEKFNFYGGVAQSFRAPNLSDLTRLDTARSGEIETPITSQLNSEKFLTYDFGIKMNKEKIRGGVSLYKTFINDLIIRTPTGRVVNGDEEVTKKNSGKGYVQGIEFWINKDINPSLSLNLQTAFMDGELDTYPNSSTTLAREPLSRLLPWTTQVSFKYEKPKSLWWAEFRSIFSAKQDNLSTRDKSDAQRIPQGGTPSYQVYTLRGGVQVSKNISVSASLENIFDKNYRVHGSGLNEAGRNGILGVNLSF